MPESLEIASHVGPYRVHFVDDGTAHACGTVSGTLHYVIDERIATLYGGRLAEVLNATSVLRITAAEHAKSLERMPDYVMHLVGRGFRRSHRLIGIGGGIIQDITCFLAATMMRGVDWMFYPTTLLAQADSCIGSKSSINVRETKNIIGTFTPPREVFIDVGFLDTLAELDVRSGIGEILKVHAISGPESFRQIAAEYDELLVDKARMVEAIRRALLIKKPFIEEDEFDTGRRRVFNYGHSFGHAIESATDFGIPHGIGVTMGMDLANFVAWRLGYAPRSLFDEMHPPLKRNYRGFEDLYVPMERFLIALGRDKKNAGPSEVILILPDGEGRPAMISRAADEAFIACCRDYFMHIRSE